jgi:glyoxylase-like metal-dependent hydrolase (beta-lactamase superfamily II)
MEWLLGADPVRPHGSVGEQMGDDARRVGGVAFTHLHPDHTGGMRELCGAAGREIAVFQTPWQQDHTNFGTELGAEDLREAGCAVPVRLAIAETGLHYPIPGFDGLYAVAVGGHTPGSTLYLARVGETVWLLAGDVTNGKPNLLADVPKPWVYSTFVTPEDRERLGELRRWLAALDAEAGVEVLVSHDLTAIRGAGVEAH